MRIFKKCKNVFKNKCVRLIYKMLSLPYDLAFIEPIVEGSQKKPDQVSAWRIVESFPPMKQG